MNVPLALANALLLLAFVAHAWMGDRELQLLRPDPKAPPALEKWLQARAGWHLVSWDLLLATIGVGLLTWTDVLAPRAVYLHLLVVYFVGAGGAWLLALVGTPSVSGRWWRLAQWALLWGIAGLIWWGS